MTSYKLNEFCSDNIQKLHHQWGFFYLYVIMATTMDLTIDNNLLSSVRGLEKKIGNTPLHPITRLFNKKNVRLYAKKEWMQLSGSVKARAAYNIIRKAIESGQL